MLVYRMVAPPFFRGETLARRGAHDLALGGMARESASVREGLGMPGSSLCDIVISPDLSNLPRGSSAIDAETGEDIQGSQGPEAQRKP